MIDTSEFVAPPKVDWFKVFQDLTNAGLVPAEVARRLQLNRQTVYRWRASQREPNGDDAIKIVAFHAWVMSRSSR